MTFTKNKKKLYSGTQIETRSTNFCLHQSNTLHVCKHLPPNRPAARHVGVKFLKISKRPSQTALICPFSICLASKSVLILRKSHGVNHIPSLGMQEQGGGRYRDLMLHAGENKTNQREAVKSPHEAALHCNMQTQTNVSERLP